MMADCSVIVMDVAALVSSHMNGSLPLMEAIDETTETMPLSRHNFIKYSCYNNKIITVYESCYTFDCDLVALDFITGITYQLLLGGTFFIVGVNAKQFRFLIQPS